MISALYLFTRTAKIAACSVLLMLPQLISMHCNFRLWTRSWSWGGRCQGSRSHRTTIVPTWACLVPCVHLFYIFLFFPSFSFFSAVIAAISLRLSLILYSNSKAWFQLCATSKLSFSRNQKVGVGEIIIREVCCPFWCNKTNKLHKSFTWPNFQPLLFLYSILLFLVFFSSASPTSLKTNRPFNSLAATLSRFAEKNLIVFA